MTSLDLAKQDMTFDYGERSFALRAYRDDGSRLPRSPSGGSENRFHFCAVGADYRKEALDFAPTIRHLLADRQHLHSAQPHTK